MDREPAYACARLRQLEHGSNLGMRESSSNAMLLLSNTSDWHKTTLMREPTLLILERVKFLLHEEECEYLIVHQAPGTRRMDPAIDPAAGSSSNPRGWAFNSRCPFK